MKTTKFFILVISLTSFLSWSQDEDSKFDSLKITKSSWGYNFYSGNREIYKYDFKNIIRKDEDAYTFFRKGNNLNIVSTIFSVGGGLGVGWLVGGMIAGGEPNWVAGGIGLGAILFSIPMSNNANNHFMKSVKVYNRNISSRSSLSQQGDLGLMISKKGIGFKLTF